MFKVFNNKTFTSELVKSNITKPIFIEVKLVFSKLQNTQNKTNKMYTEIYIYWKVSIIKRSIVKNVIERYKFEVQYKLNQLRIVSLKFTRDHVSTKYIEFIANESNKWSEK